MKYVFLVLLAIVAGIGDGGICNQVFTESAAINREEKDVALCFATPDQAFRKSLSKKGNAEASFSQAFGKNLSKKGNAEASFSQAFGKNLSKMEIGLCFANPGFPTQNKEWLDKSIYGRHIGVHIALVSDVRDPENQGRVRIKLPWLSKIEGYEYEEWARVATLMAGDNRGTWFMPDVNDEVLVAFEDGDALKPYVLGALWKEEDTPPGAMDSAGSNYVKTLRSRNGIQITLDDSGGQEKVTVETPGGQTLTLKDGPGSIELQDSNGNTIKMGAGGITITSPAKVSINASTMEVSAGMVTINSAMSKLSGIVQADTVMANSIVSSSYTPGAGNVR